jgi:hypothetical protein
MLAQDVADDLTTESAINARQQFTVAGNARIGKRLRRSRCQQEILFGSATRVGTDQVKFECDSKYNKHNLREFSIRCAASWQQPTAWRGSQNVSDGGLV